MDRDLLPYARASNCSSDPAVSLNFLNIQPLLKRYGIQPKKSLGQNFLVEPAGLMKVINAAELCGDEEVLEIGAGLGSLTYLLAQTCARVSAVEIDRHMLEPLAEALKLFSNVQIVPGDILELDPAKLVNQENYVVVANIPYYITSAIIRHLLEAKLKPSRVILTIQKEVAQRIVARDGKMSLLSLSVFIFGEPEIVGTIPAGSFFPAPDVDSAVLRIRLHPEPLIPAPQLDQFFKLAHAGFGQKRKTLRNSLSSGLSLPTGEVEARLIKAEIDPSRRAETLSVAEWARLVTKFN
ncbi:MAG TPA: 16S rRNA (adenine(1518)-N(6)/adenine(1519)-N(6))-dimethyltransferase RsmA [Anaerolineaceae bacterium]|nr:16S rRNA (adenine(1518)-N(6)/adenine(1519)-N(6))-dimethyltransferase RsmA [Anaerolineaceae bacterium]